MIKDLFHSPPHYKANVVLSWKPRDGKGKAGAEKRRLVAAAPAATKAADKGQFTGSSDKTSIFYHFLQYH